MMNHERLAFLGTTLQREFQALIAKFYSGWLYDASLQSEDWQENRLIEAEVYRLTQLDAEFLALEHHLTSGFFPADLARVGTECRELLPSKSAAASDWFFETSPRAGGDPYRTGNVSKESEKQSQEDSAFEEELRPLSKDEQMRPVRGLKDLAGLFESEHLQAKASGTHIGLASDPDDEDAALRYAPASRLPPEDYFLFLSFPQAGDADKSILSPYDDDTSHLTSESARNLRAVSLRETENLDKTIPLSFNDDPKRWKGKDTGILKKQGLKSPTLAPFEAQHVKAQHSYSQGHKASDNAASIREQRRAVVATVDAVEENENAVISDHVSDLDLHDILEGLTREIQREYKRFYGS